MYPSEISGSVRRASRILTAIVLGVLAWASGPALAQVAPVRIDFAAGPDGSGVVKRAIESFNAANAGRVEVTWRVMDRDNNTHRQQLVDAFEAQESAPHVLASDVIWTAEFARNGWVQDVTDRFYDDYDRDALLEPAVKSATHRLRLWGVPWYTDASLLFYRKDLLAASGFNQPPRTWDELASMAAKVKQDSGTEHGFVFQGADYEGGTVNALEFIWSAGGDVMHSELWVTSTLRGALAEADAVTIDTEQAASGLDVARKLVADGVVPTDVLGFREQEALDVFLAGDAVFLRSWPYVQAAVQTSSLAPDSVGVGLLPAVSESEFGYSALGGFNLMVNARAGDKERAAAWSFIRHLTSADQQKRAALEAGLLPVVKALYDDADVLAGVPVAAIAGETVISGVRVRPMTPFYAELSARIADAFQQVLKGEVSGADAVASLDGDLRAIAMRNR